ncbi:MAG: preprotein translocase subunit YajC [Proteobacteria bacterium]|nr:preprotein translocase subunit YajC [Pseudomonadota bacterium]
MPYLGVSLPLVAQASGAAAQGSFSSTILLFGVIGAIWYFLLIRPQVQEQKDHKAMLAGLVKGDMVVARGGLIVKVVEVKQDELLVDLGNTKARLEKSSVTRKWVPGDAQTKEA